MKRNSKEANEGKKQELKKFYRDLKIISNKNFNFDKKFNDLCVNKEDLIKEIVHVDNLYWTIRKHVILDIN